MRIILCGFGVVAQSFSELLESRTHDLYSKFGLNPRIVGVFDSKGCAYDEAGLDLKKRDKAKKQTGSVSVNTNPSPSSELRLWAGGPAGPLQHRRRLRPQLLSVLVQDRRVRPRLKVLEATDLQTPNENVMPRTLEVGGGGGCCSDLDRVAGHQEVPRLGLGQHVPHGQLLVLHHVLHRVDRALNKPPHTAQ